MCATFSVTHPLCHASEFEWRQHSQSCHHCQQGLLATSDQPAWDKKENREVVVTVSSDLHWVPPTRQRLHVVISTEQTNQWSNQLYSHLFLSTQPPILKLSHTHTLTSASVKRSPIVVSSSLSLSSWIFPVPSSSKQAKAFLITSSGSVPMEIHVTNKAYTLVWFAKYGHNVSLRAKHTTYQWVSRQTGWGTLWSWVGQVPLTSCHQQPGHWALDLQSWNHF